MECEDLPEELTIYYNGEDVRVVTECSGHDTFFLVYLPLEPSPIRVHMDVDADGNEAWMEGEISTTRAEEIGRILEAV